MSNELIVGKAISHGPGLRTYIGQLHGTPDFERPSLMPRGTDRKVAVVSELNRVNSLAMEKAAPGLKELQEKGLVTRYEVNPLSNTVVVDVPEDRAGEAYKALNQVPEMGRLIRNREVHLAPLEQAEEGAAIAAQPSKFVPNVNVEWNVAKVGADQLWAQGVTGEGVVVGTVDTGADFTHPAIHDKYRGLRPDGTVDNNYNFFDAVNGKKGNPYDDNKHGTHVTGTMVGGTADHAIGMAPNAKWIVTKILSGSGSGSLEGVTKGLEWMLAPRDENGQNPDPTKAPDLVSNSWGTNNGSMTNFQNIWKSYVAAGIEPIAAAGNAGPRPKTVGAPGSYAEGISVAATDNNDVVASFSSRGPSPLKGADGSDRKPDVAAPGVNVTSSVPGGGYAAFSGTSMATPAVSGVVALLLSKHKDLTHEEVVKSLQGSAKDLGTAGYDYDYGYGRVDAAAALKAADALVAARKPATK
jgi:bacillopeptidase F